MTKLLTILLFLTNLLFSITVERFYSDDSYHIISINDSASTYNEWRYDRHMLQYQEYVNTSNWSYVGNDVTNSLNSNPFFKQKKSEFELLEHKFNSKCIFYYDDNETIRKEENYKDGYKYGEWIEYYKNGTIRKEENYKDGCKYGEWKKYYKNGRILESKNYEIETTISEYSGSVQRTSRLDGKWTWYYSNGNIWKIEEYKMGVPEGTWIYYYDNIGSNLFERIYYGIKSFFYGHGEVRWEKTYSYGHLLNHISYFRNGDVKESQSYNIPKWSNLYNHDINNNIKDGIWISHYYNSLIKEQGEYKNRKKVGEWKNYYRSGVLSSIGKYINGEKEGEWKTFHPSGAISSIGRYVSGKKEGEWKTFLNRLEPQLASIGKYVSGKEEGEWKTFHPSGVMSSIGNYVLGKKEGKWKNFRDRSGPQLASIGKYVSGKEEGEWVFYDYKSNIAQIGSYIKGNKEGEWKNFFTMKDDSKFNQLESQANFKNGVLHGSIKKYYMSFDSSESKKCWEANFINGSINGESISYWENGNISEVINYINGEQDKWIRFSVKGDTLHASNFKYSLPWYEDHVEIITFGHGIYDGQFITIKYYKKNDADKNIIKETQYHSGRIIYEKNYDNEGKLHGKQIQYNFSVDHSPDYWITSSENFIHGKLEGLAYYSGHYHKKNINYKDGILHGDYYSYTSATVEQGRYDYGSKVGVWFSSHLDLDGSLIKLLYNNSGNLIEATKYHDRIEDTINLDKNYKGSIHLKVSMLNGEYTIYDKSGKIVSSGSHIITDYEKKNIAHGLFWNILDKKW